MLFLLMFFFLLLFNSSSNAPSRTININPTVPIIGKSECKSGNSIFKKVVNCLTIQPSISKRTIVGIFVFLELKSKM